MGRVDIREKALAPASDSKAYRFADQRGADPRSLIPEHRAFDAMLTVVPKANPAPDKKSAPTGGEKRHRFSGSCDPVRKPVANGSLVLDG